MKIKEILFDAKEPTTYCESFIYEPTNVEEEKLGNLFMIGRVRNVPENSFFLINLLASRIKREYYRTSHKSPGEAIEKALREGNWVLKESEARINWLGNLDFLVAGATKNKIYLTQLGKIKSFILRQNEVIDLVKNLILEKDFLFPFSTIIQANLKKGDVLIFSTSNIFTQEKLLAMGKELFPVEEKKIKKNIGSSESGVALVVETEKTAEAIERLEPKIPKKGGLDLKIPRPSIPTKKMKNFGNAFLKIGKKIKELFSKIPANFKKPKTKIQEEIPRITLEKKPQGQVIWQKAKKRFLKPKTIISILISIIALIAVVFGVYSFRQNEKNKDIEAVIETANTKKSEGENALIYGDKEKALSLFEESINTLQSIENPPQKQKSQIDNLIGDLDKKIAEMVGRKIISDISPLFEVKKGTEKWEASQILIQEESIYVASSISGQIYKWDASKKEGQFSASKGENVLAQTIVAKTPIFLLSPTLLALEGETKNLEITPPYENLKATEMESFGNYFYIFDSEKGEIAKYELKGKDVSSPQLWLKERNTGKGALSMAIDGSIYLVFPNAIIKKFSGGALSEEIKMPKTYPEIKNVSKIFTSKDNKYLYLIEPSEKRIIVIDKKGNMVSEYQGLQFESLKDIWASPDDKNIYLLSDNKIYLISTSN